MGYITYLTTAKFDYIEVNMSKTDNQSQFEQLEYAISKESIDEITTIYEHLSTNSLKHDNYELFSELTIKYISYASDQNYLNYVKKYALRFISVCESRNWHIIDTGYSAIAATMYYNLHDYKNAAIHVLNQINLSKELGNEMTLAHCYGNLGYLYILDQKYVEALDILQDAVSIYSSHKNLNPPEKMKTLQNLVHVYLELEDMSKAKKYMNIILNWHDIDKNTSIKQELYTAFAHFYSKSNNNEEALLYLYEAIEIAEGHNSNKALLDLYNDTIEILISEENHTDIMPIHKKARQLTKLILERNTQSNYRLFKNELDYVHHELDFLSDDNNLAANDLDTLTCAYNRDFLNKHVEHLFYASSSDSMPFSLMLIDLDDFNIINTKHGHHIGDKVLQAVAKNLNSHLVDDQELVRYAGDRFIITMANTTKVQAKADALNYLKMIKDQVYLKDQYDIQITASAGLVESMDSKAKNLSDLLRLCDLVLFQAKKSGKKQLSQW